MKAKKKIAKRRTQKTSVGQGKGAGRPSLYSEGLQVKADKYLIDYEKHGNPVPTVAGLSVVLGIGRRTLQDWDKSGSKPEFSRTLERLKAIQETKLISGGLLGTFNAAITKLMLHNHGYHDKVDNRQSDPDGGPVKHNVIITYVDPDGSRSMNGNS